MLYTARPLERIYAAPSTFDPSKQERPKDTSDLEYRDVILPSGRLITRRDGENYVIEQIYSTDMKDYLNQDYCPGKNVKN